jgi:hypothetical protein
MTDIETSVKSQFATVFAIADWCRFKKMAEANLQEAATLLEKDMLIEDSMKLLARNSRKRLLIGVGVELLLKAIYLKKGYAINTSPNGTSLRFPFLADDATRAQLVKDKTVTLHALIEKLPEVVQLQKKDSTIKGLQIAKVFRNKEGHVVTRDHKFDSSNYTDIASSLVDLYRDAFGETLSVRFSMARNELAIWRISP